MKSLPLFLLLAGFALGATELELKTPTGMLRGSLEESGNDSSLVVLILPGSGPTDRDGNSLGLPGKNDSLRMLAEKLSANGVSSVRIDKRGVGGSTEAAPKKEDDLLFDTYVDDTVAWLNHLETELRFKRTVILGHSEGALVGLVAANKKPIAAYISLAAPAKRASAVLREQLKTKLPPELLGEATVILQQLDQGRKVSKISSDLAVLFRPSVQPYLISWIKYTPTEELAKLNVPALILQGNTDIQVATTHGEDLHAAKPESTLVTIEGMNHVLKAVEPDMPAQIASYSDPKQPLHPGLIPPLLEFITKLPQKTDP
jgi:pimeloyl-ACP methyl ester carboxylesterase